jgi:hypothetical protein
MLPKILALPISQLTGPNVPRAPEVNHAGEVVAGLGLAGFMLAGFIFVLAAILLAPLLLGWVRNWGTRRRSHSARG